ncbi:MAG: archaemetzincin family Zn-dependent metalloprotease [Candidatus Aenigmatarchaeota archaeon]
MKITIVQLGKIPEEVLTAIASELREKFELSTETTRPIEIPKEIYNEIRHQYPAPLVLKFLSEKFQNKTLGVTDKDLYAENLNFVFGQAYYHGNYGVVSIHRLDPTFYRQKPDKNLLIERAVKEAIHEVGHMLGLGHCSISTCVMSFSNTIGDVDRKNKELCQSCRKKVWV